MATEIINDQPHGTLPGDVETDGCDWVEGIRKVLSKEVEYGRWYGDGHKSTRLEESGPEAGVQGVLSRAFNTNGGRLSKGAIEVEMIVIN